MPRRQIREIEVVDTSTGEVLSGTRSFVTKRDISFIMLNTSDGFDWFYPLGKNEKSLIMMLHNWSNVENMRISLSRWQRHDITVKLHINKRQVSVLLKSLCDSNCIKRLGQNDFIVNPSHVFKGSTSELIRKKREYDSL